MIEHLPRGRRLAALGDLGSWHGGGAPRKGRSDHWTNGTVPWRSPKDMWAEIVATSTGITDLDNAPFTERGGIDGAIRDLGAEAGAYIPVLSAELTA